MTFIGGAVPNLLIFLLEFAAQVEVDFAVAFQLLAEQGVLLLQGLGGRLVYHLN